MWFHPRSRHGFMSVALLLIGVVAAGCGSDGEGEPLPSVSISAPDADELTLNSLPDADSIIANPNELPVPQPRANPHPEVVITTSMGDVTVKLDAEKASETVDNFLENYVRRGFYANTIFHYVERDFIIVGGGYTGDLKPKQTRAPIRNEADNGLPNKKGTIAMSRQSDYIHSSTSQFFFNLDDNDSLDHDAEGGETSYGYCVFGEVVEGFDVLEKIAGVAIRSEGEFQNLPTEHVLIKSVRLVE